MSKQRDLLYRLIVKDQSIAEAASNVCRRYTHLDPNDLIQELYIHLASVKIDKIKDIIENDYVKWYCLKFFTIQTLSERSPFISKYKSKGDVVDYIENIELPNESDVNEELIDFNQLALKLIYNDFINDIHWYDKFIFFELYINQRLSIEKISKKLGIPNSSIKATIRKTKDAIKTFITKKNKIILDNI